MARSSNPRAAKASRVVRQPFSKPERMLPLCLLLIAASLAGCEHQSARQNNPLNSNVALKYQAPKDICGEIVLQEKIGDNVQESLDEITRRKREQGFDNVVLEIQKLQEVKNTQGELINLNFYVVIVKDPNTGLKVHSWHEVIDETGNLYFINWCPD